MAAAEDVSTATERVRRRLQLAAVHEAGHILVTHHFGYRVEGAWLEQRELANGDLRVGGKTASQIPQIDNDLTRELARVCSTIFMAGIAAELVFDPSTRGTPDPWSDHPDIERRDVDGYCEDPSDVDWVYRYCRQARPPVSERDVAGEVARAYRGARVILAQKKAPLARIADAVGLSHNSGAQLSEDDLRHFLVG